MFNRVRNTLFDSKIGFIKEVSPKSKENLLIMRDRPLMNTSEYYFAYSTGPSDEIFCAILVRFYLL